MKWPGNVNITRNNMSFYLNLGSPMQHNDFKNISRTAAKGVAGHSERMLMVKTYRHGYKFPGGGAKAGEDLLQALSREIKEETGMSVVNIGNEVGTVYEKRPDIYDPLKNFIMKTVFIKCSIDETAFCELSLDAYEKELGFTPVFINIKEAIAENEHIIMANPDFDPWLFRDTMVLKRLLGNF